MKITINDRPTEFAEGTSLAQAMAECNVPEKGTAVALNGKIARRDSWAQTMLRDGDNIIIISAAYGG